MPSKSPKQKKLMQAAAHNKEFAKKVGVFAAVAKEFVKENKKKSPSKKRKGYAQAAVKEK